MESRTRTITGAMIAGKNYEEDDDSGIMMVMITIFEIIMIMVISVITVIMITVIITGI